MERKRIDSLDLLRGLVMVIMALDHVRDFFFHGMFTSDPTDLATTTVPLFFTRWITHFCAPVFVFLAGVSAYLIRSRRGVKALSRLLWTRGLWLVLVEIFIVRFGWQFDPGFSMVFLQVIWAIGIGMLVLSALVYLPRSVVLGIGVAIIALHPLLYPIELEGTAPLAVLFYALHQGGFVPVGEGIGVFFAYPVLPWVGVIAAGYGFGVLYTPITTSRQRRKWLLGLGMGAIALFLALRLPDLYGEPRAWSSQQSPAYTVMSILHCTKYPPSLLYLCMTLGPAFLFLAWADARSYSSGHPFIIFGRVPFFYYILHIYLIHALAMVALWADGDPVRLGIITPDSLGNATAYADTGFDLWVVYAVWLTVVALLYVPCRWFANFRAEHPGRWWLSYL